MAEQETKSQQVSESDPTHIDNLMDMLGAGAKKSQAQEQSASQEDGKPKLTATHQGWQYFSDGTVISPDNVYFKDGEQITGAGGKPLRQIGRAHV